MTIQDLINIGVLAIFSAVGLLGAACWLSTKGPWRHG